MTLVAQASELRRELLSTATNVDTVLALHQPFLTDLAEYLESQVLTIDDLPTEDPGVAGQLWNDGGTPTVSTG